MENRPEYKVNTERAADTSTPIKDEFEKQLSKLSHDALLLVCRLVESLGTDDEEEIYQCWRELFESYDVIVDGLKDSSSAKPYLERYLKERQDLGKNVLRRLSGYDRRWANGDS